MISLLPSRTVSRFLFAMLLLEGGFGVGRAADAPKIDRQALVGRHTPTNHAFDASSPLTVGNGQFAFSVDATGLQTFPEEYHHDGIPIETLSRWAWHTNANPEHFKLEDSNKPYTSYGKTVSYPTNTKPAAAQWLRENPQDVPLALIGFDVADASSSPLRSSDFHDLNQTLDLWKGVVTSHSTLNGAAIEVTTTVHPELDLIAVRLVSSLLKDGKLGVKIAFPRGHDIKQKNNPSLDWSKPEAHTTRLEKVDANQVTLKRQIDDTHYEAAVRWAGKAELMTKGPHYFRLIATEGDTLEFVIAFSPDGVSAKLPDFAATLKASAAHWSNYWKSGGVVDFSGSTDPRAQELERRIVLSQYLTAVQFGGDFPPQETGLTSDSWYGKHHTEMIWWHMAHFALWSHDEYLGNALKWFQKSLPVARQIASSRGLQGARWPKMIGPEGRESPGGNPLIVWNQPHVIYLAELLYRNKPTKETLEHYRELVSETAQCMSSMLHWDEDHKRYVLGPPLWISQEIYDQSKSMNPAFELSYWAFCLELAQQWRVRLGQPRSEEWDKNLKALSPLPVKDGRYVALESIPDTFDVVESRHDHPTMLAPFGVLPGNGVDPATMRRTLDAVLKTWDWETKIWGWDYPMIAMTATRLKDPSTAIDILLKDGPNNHYTPNGHCPQREDLPVYLPANGALLSAVALMVAGWDGGPTTNAPGFPQDGRWTVRSEGVHRLP